MPCHYNYAPPNTGRGLSQRGLIMTDLRIFSRGLPTGEVVYYVNLAWMLQEMEAIPNNQDPLLPALRKACERLGGDPEKIYMVYEDEGEGIAALWPYLPELTDGRHYRCGSYLLSPFAGLQMALLRWAAPGEPDAPVLLWAEPTGLDYLFTSVTG